MVGSWRWKRKKEKELSLLFCYQLSEAYCLNHGLIRLKDYTDEQHNKSVKSINPCKSVIQTNFDIVKAHGGEIKVETKEGEGSEFIIVLPIVWITDLQDLKITRINELFKRPPETKSVKSIDPCKSVIQTNFDIVKAHGGEIKVETKEGEGNEFIVSLPIVWMLD